MMRDAYTPDPIPACDGQLDLLAGKTHRHDPPASHAAAQDPAAQWAWRGLRGEVLVQLARVLPEVGLTANELHRMLEPANPHTPVHSVGTRLIELRERGLVERITDDTGELVSRAPFYDPHGRVGHPHRITAAGRAVLAART